MPVPLLALGAAALTSYFLAPEVATQVQRLKETESIRNELNRAEAYRAFDAGANAVEKDGDLVYQAAGFVPGIGAIDRSRQERFFYSAKAELQRQGYNESKANEVANALMRDYAARSASELPTALATEGVSEVIGSRVLTRVLPKTVERKALGSILNPIAKAGAKSSTVAGLYEGGATVIAEDISRRRFGKQEESTLFPELKKGSMEARVTAQLERVGIGSAAGAVVAGTFGTIIAGQRIPRKRVSQLAELSGNIVDVGEYPGDKIANRLRKQFNEPEVPSVRVRGRPDVIPQSNGHARGISFIQALTQGYGNTQSRNQSQSRAQNNANSRGKGFGLSYTNQPGYSQNINDQPLRRSRTGYGSSQTPGQVQDKTENNENSKQETNTNTNSRNPVPIPSTSAIFRGGAPILPLLPGVNEGPNSLGGGGNRDYIDELRKGARLFRRLI